MSPPIDRRFLLKAGAGLGLAALFTRCRTTQSLRVDRSGILALAEGFTLSVVQRRGDLMSDGLRVPGLPDGMGCFPGPDGTLVLMRNHELAGSDGAYPQEAAPPEAYDARFVGGVTRLVLDAQTLAVRHSNLVLTGTRRNCAGGATPWGWLSCEEDVLPGHGYVFVCDPTAESVRPPAPVPAWGRMNHEAAVMDPETATVYLTEDRVDSCLYRFVPSDPWAPPGPRTKGQLEALKIRGVNARDMNDASQGAVFDVEWIPLDRADDPEDSLRRRGRELGAAIFRRGEGAFFHEGAVFFTATTGGPAGGGQVWRLGVADQRLTLLAQSTDRTRLDMPDNLCVGPRGEVVLAEDGDDPRWPDQHLRVLTADGRLLDLARNAISSFEFAGVCFSPAGDTLFCNLQAEGLTLAIRGPFQAFVTPR